MATNGSQESHSGKPALSAGSLAMKWSTGIWICVAISMGFRLLLGHYNNPATLGMWVCGVAAPIYAAKALFTKSGISLATRALVIWGLWVALTAVGFVMFQ